MEELSLAYVRAVASRAGFAVEEVRRDRDSIDLHILAGGTLGGGALHSPALAVQVKATAFDLPEGCTQFPYDLKVRNYNHLAQQPTPRPRAAPPRTGCWLTWTEEALVLRRSAYWLSLCGLPATSNEGTSRVHLPRTQVFDSAGIRGLLERISRQEAIVT
ncbi:DUF4365 domain-containing protein [Nannocystis sp.]|uniref:DUF4365 domain-containing protein n=1 Tax=Nannocystis sp. TaxID=1962667 RepID=UPI0025F3B664|nr:DUF4365 domain-containing protein [Nannocystis sp.]MBK7826295.1 DUF4365 domain-containing protein [Nannocystis sp.]